MTLKEYIYSHILPRYDAFDRGHQRDHALSVMEESIKLARQYDADEEMCFVIAAYHDLGLSVDREFHHIHSGEILMADQQLREWFSPQQIQNMREAVEDHRASSKKPPRSIYGAIVAEADRQINPDTVLTRTIQFGLKQNPDEDFNWHFKRACDHLNEKYAEGGYMHLWLNSERNIQGLNDLRNIINDKQLLRKKCLEIYNRLTLADKQ